VLRWHNMHIVNWTRKENTKARRKKTISKIVPIRPPASERHLLAVDMGLRTGLAIFGPDGRLISYRSKHFGSLAELRRGVGTILRECPPLGWLWLEGGGDIAVVWEKHCAYLGIDFRQVQASDWRKTLMLPRQQVSGEKAKKEAIVMAKRVIEWSGAPRPKGPLRHDAAEAILVGVHGAVSVALLDCIPPM
jgi:hypothetical protein